jgi:hypothetical protein
MAKRRSFALFSLALLQSVFWTPYLFHVPWQLPEGRNIGGHWLWSDFYFDLGTATDFVPAVGMVVAGVFGMAVGVRRHSSMFLLSVAIFADFSAVLVLIGIETVGQIIGVIRWGKIGLGFVFNVLLWFGPPVLSMMFMQRQKRSAI